MTLSGYDCVKSPARRSRTTRCPNFHQPTLRLPATIELEHLKELLAEAEEMCLVLALEKHMDSQRAARELERLSKETGERGRCG